MIQCCGQDMLEAGMFFHCEKCGKRLIDTTNKTDAFVIDEILYNFISDGLVYDIKQKDFLYWMHEIYKCCKYEEYIPDYTKLPNQLRKDLGDLKR